MLDTGGEEGVSASQWAEPRHDGGSGDQLVSAFWAEIVELSEDILLMLLGES